MNYSVTTKNSVQTTNVYIRPDGFSSILLKNIGADIAYINDNIPLAPGSSFSFDNQPYVTMGENTDIRFNGVDANRKVLVVKSYFKERR